MNIPCGASWKDQQTRPAQIKICLATGIYGMSNRNVDIKQVEQVKRIKVKFSIPTDHDMNTLLSQTEIGTPSLRVMYYFTR